MRTTMEIMDHLTLSFEFPDGIHVNYEANQLPRRLPGWARSSPDQGRDRNFACPHAAHQGSRADVDRMETSATYRWMPSMDSWRIVRTATWRT